MGWLHDPAVYGLASIVGALAAGAFGVWRVKIRADRDQSMLADALKNAQPSEVPAILEAASKIRHFSPDPHPRRAWRWLRQ